ADERVVSPRAGNKTSPDRITFHKARFIESPLHKVTGRPRRKNRGRPSQKLYASSRSAFKKARRNLSRLVLDNSGGAGANKKPLSHSLKETRQGRRAGEGGLFHRLEEDAVVGSWRAARRLAK